jgi:Cu/Ag efflux pump CusA
MTALCAALALLPLAIVILGGLVTSTALNLLVMPARYLAFASRGRGDAPRTPGS